MPDFQGFVWQGDAYEGLTCNALEWQVSNGGGSIIEADGTVSVNNEHAIAAFDRAKGWVGTISPEGVTDLSGRGRPRRLAGRQRRLHAQLAVRLLAWASRADSVIKDKFDVTLVPMGDGEGARNADTLGGWQMMVSKYSENQGGGGRVRQYMTSLECRSPARSSAASCRRSPTLYDDADVLEANPFFAS